MTKWYIKEFSSMTGISMRSLRHYDEMGLITPSLRLKTGYRLYSSMDLARAQQVIALKSFGIELQDIKSVLDDNVDLSSYFNKQMMLLKEKIQGLQEASHILEQVTAELSQKKSISISKIMKLIGIYTMSTTHFETYLKKTGKLDSTQIENLLKEHSNLIASPLTSEEIEETQKMNLALMTEEDVNVTIVDFIKKSQEDGLSDEDTMKAVQKMMASRMEKMIQNGYTKERMDLLKKAGKYFNQKMALAMTHDYLATSSEVQDMIKEHFALTPSALETDRQVLRESYKNMPANEQMRAYLDDLTPGLVDFMAEAMLFFIDNQAK